MAKITFLGTNGWYPTDTGQTITTLIEIDDRYIVLDAGTGMGLLDSHATNQDKPVDVFLSHFHLDHVFGLHVQPKFRFKNEMRIFGQTGTKQVLGQLINHPFTAPFSMLKAKITVHELNLGENTVEPPDNVKGNAYTVMALPLVHADSCWGFRFEFNEGGKTKAIAYCTDTGPCENIIKLGQNADMLITECSLLPGEEIPPSWPHMNPEAAAKAANEAGCRQLVLTHFAAHKFTTHELRAEAEKEARKLHPETLAAKDGMVLEV